MHPVEGAMCIRICLPNYPRDIKVHMQGTAGLCIAATSVGNIPLKDEYIAGAQISDGCHHARVRTAEVQLRGKESGCDEREVGEGGRRLYEARAQVHTSLWSSRDRKTVQGGVSMAASYLGKSKCHTCALQPAKRRSPVGSAKLLLSIIPSSKSAFFSSWMAGASKFKGMPWRFWHLLSPEAVLLVMLKGGARFHECAIPLSVRRGGECVWLLLACAWS